MKLLSLDHKGSTLTEVLVAIGIIGIVATSLSQFYGSNFRAQRRIRKKMVQESIGRNIANKLSTPSAIYLSLLNRDNPELIRCMLGSGVGCTERMTKPLRQPSLISEIQKNRQLFSQNLTPFSLVYPTFDREFKPISSSSLLPVYYDTNGAPGCKKSETNCIFRVDTFFYARCPAVGSPAVTPSRCTEGAETLYFYYDVRMVKKLNEGGKAHKRFSSLPKRLEARIVQVKDILGPNSNSSCNPFAVIKGFGANGKPICECAPTYVDAGVEPNRLGIVCSKADDTSLYCRDQQVFRGLKDDGTARCVDFADAYDCKESDGTIDDYLAKGGTCGPDYWINMDVRRNCRFYCAVGKGGSLCRSYEDPSTKPSNVSGRVSGPGGRIYRHRKVLKIEGGTEIDKIAKLMPSGSGFPSGGTVSVTVKEGLVCQSYKLRCCRPKKIR